MQHLISRLQKNKLFAAALVVELAVTVWLIAGLFGPAYALTWTPDQFTNNYSGIAALSEDGSALQIYNEERLSFDKEVTFSSTGAAVPSGAYAVTVEYFSCQTPDAPTFNVQRSAGSLTFSSAKVPSAVQADTLTLDDGHRTVSTRLWIGAGARLQDLTATLHYGEGQLYLYSIRLVEQPIYRVTRLFCFLVFAAVADALGWLFFACVGAKGSARRRALRLPLILLGITAVACLPLLSSQLYSGHDLCYHMQRITATAAEMSYGQFPVRITTDTLNGYGYINPLCYCELFLLLPALLYNAWLPMRVCYQVYVFAVTLATCGFSYLCFAKIFGSRRAGVLGSALYTLSAYRLVCVYFRAAVGEYTAMTFLPLVLLGVYEIYTCEKPRFAHWAPLAFGMAGLVQSHLISTELTGAFLVLVCLLRLRQTLRPARLLAWVKAALLAFGLSAWFLIPFLSTTLSVPLQVNGDLVNKPQQEALTLMQLLNPFGPGNGGTSKGTSSDMSLTLGLPLVLGVALVFLCLLRRDRWKLSPALRLTAGLGTLAALLSLQIFPWDYLETWFGFTFGKLAGTLQYPWRFLSLATILFCAATLFALQVIARCHPERLQLIVGILAAAMVLTVGVFQTQLLTCPEISANTISRDDTRDVGVGEYVIDGCSIYETVWAQPKPGSEELTLTNYEKIRGVAYLSVENAGADADISVPIFNYGHYTATDTATGTVFAITSGENARIVLNIPAGYSGTIAIAWHNPVWWRGCELFSLLCAAGCLVYVLYRRKTVQ